MEAVEIYSKCKESICGIKSLFNYYEKYQHCIAVSCLNSELNAILRKIAHTYTLLMVKENKDIGFNNLVIVRDDEDVEAMAEENPLFINEVIDLLDKHRDPIVKMLNIAAPQRKMLYLANFESCLHDTGRIINRMEMMIRNSQTIRRSYLKAAA